MENLIIVPESFSEEGGWLHLREEIGFASTSSQNKYNAPEEVYTDSAGELLPYLEDETCVLVAYHIPYHKDEVEVPELLEVERTNPLQRTLDRAGYENPEFSYEQVAFRFRVKISRDGWMRLLLFRLKLDQQEGIWVDTVTGKIMKAGDDGIAAEIQAADLLDEPQLMQYELDRFYYPTLQKVHDRLVARKSLMAISSRNYPPEMAKLKMQEDFLDTLLAGAGEQFEEGNKYNAQRIVEFAKKYSMDEKLYYTP
jgi:hypothetical protein